MSDEKKFPPSLNTSTKQLTKARRLVEEHLQTSTKKARFPRIQGMFSKTVIVTLTTGTEVVVQFRYERLDIEPFERAHKLLDGLVPKVEILQDEELEASDLWPVYMNCIPGVTWLERCDRWKPELNVVFARSLGRALSRCFVDGSSAEAVKHTIRPKLEKLLSSEQEQIKPFRSDIQGLLNDVHQLENLPLFLSHLDLNEMNIMVLENGELSGILDWELSPPPRPFGMGCNRLHTIAGQINNAQFSERENYEEMERGFWEEIVGGAQEPIRTTLENNYEAIQTSFMIGTVLDGLETEDGCGFNQAVLNALPKFLTYRIPALRGDRPPYG
ncbi:MAG: hypothetical protein M1832_002835 [Thelocarpon impressellum]|nr:MAG: hypothetical protein M1832_002835 [Thelocarpon impressellum]